MDFNRVWHTFRLCTIRTPMKRAEYLKKHHVYASMGEGCSFQGRMVPLYANLIKFGDYVDMAPNVTFLTHDVSHKILNKYKGSYEFKENAGCIEIGNNVYIGYKVVIFNNVKIGDNVIIAPGSVVQSDIPSNCLVGGDPASVKCSIDMLCALRSMRAPYPDYIKLRDGDSATKEAAEYLWKEFENGHKRED